MRIVIDMQGTQSESRSRGIGRYSLAFTQAIVRNCGTHEVLLALNGLFPETIQPIQRAFKDILPRENIRVWEAPGPVSSMDKRNTLRRQIAQVIYEAFLASLKPDIVHITSLFEGFCDDAVTSIAHFTTGIPTSVTFYDLIPLHDPEWFLNPNPAFKTWYFEKLTHLKKAELLLAISDFSAKDAHKRLDLPEKRITNISTGYADFFRPLWACESTRPTFLSRLGIDRPFILASGTLEPHKNLKALFQAFSVLPDNLCQTHCLVLIGKVTNTQQSIFTKMLHDVGLSENHLIITGHVSNEDLVLLYNFCELMVFPSMAEGFGLPALEAMACGAPTIGSNAASIPEVIGRKDALFDPRDTGDMARLIARVLNDTPFRQALRTHAPDQAAKFSWNKTARQALRTMESLITKKRPQPKERRWVNRPKLAFVSPLPPERTGIADYSADLLPALANHYDITLILAQDCVDKTLIGNNFPIQDSQWLRTHARQFDRVIYQMGNSPFHEHMLALMRDVPGMLVLHDFYLSGLYAWLGQVAPKDGLWENALYTSHGYPAVRDKHHDTLTAQMNYPVNLDALRAAVGIIVHSEYARYLADRWYGDGTSRDWQVIPQLCARMPLMERDRARAALSLPQDAFIICSFGFLDEVKLNHRLLEAFLRSKLKADEQCYLIFAGERNGGDYGDDIDLRIRESGISHRIHVTGWLDREQFDQYLSATDIAVQLRTKSRGETSRATLECMSTGLPLVVNAHGSFAEIPEDAAILIKDEFEDAQLITTLETLRTDKRRRTALGISARKIIAERHTPEACAREYAAAIETFHNQKSNQSLLPAIIETITAIKPSLNKKELIAYSMSLATSFPEKRFKRQLLLDITATRSNGLKTGIERVARATICALLKTPPTGFRIEPVYLSKEENVWRYRYARRFTLELLNSPSDHLTDDYVEPEAGDILLGLDISGHPLIEAEASGLIAKLRNRGLSIYFTVYDLLPLRLPHCFPPGTPDKHEQWLRAVLKTDGALCISRCVADDLHIWAQNHSPTRLDEFKIGWFHQGADIDKATPTKGMPENAPAVLTELSIRPTFLMVGTIEPRKGYLQALHAFETLWKHGLEINLVIIGAQGWTPLPDEMRRNIPETISSLRTHPQMNHRLFWLEGISDEYLEKVYAASTCLIAASEGEGFGLPLIEAARHKLPILARDIPIFREVAGDHAVYFSGLTPEDLAEACKSWLSLYQDSRHPRSDDMPWLTWAQSAQQLVRFLLPSTKENEPPSSFSHKKRTTVTADCLS